MRKAEQRQQAFEHLLEKAQNSRAAELIRGIEKCGIVTASDISALLSAIMSDLASNRITPTVGNAMANAANKLTMALKGKSSASARFLFERKTHVH